MSVQQGTLLEVLKKKMRGMKEELEVAKEAADDAQVRLQEEVRRREEAESEVAALNRRIQLLEEDLERSEERLKIATQKLEEASQAADESERIRKALENRTNMEDDRITLLETQLGQARLIAEESDKKYEEMARRIAMLEADLERAEERASIGESKIVELEEELRVVGNNMKSLEVSEERAMQKEEAYEITIRQLTQRLQEAEARAEFAERSVQKLQKEVDRLEGEQMEKIVSLNDLPSERDGSSVPECSRSLRRLIPPTKNEDQDDYDEMLKTSSETLQDCALQTLRNDSPPLSSQSSIPKDSPPTTGGSGSLGSEIESVFEEIWNLAPIDDSYFDTPEVIEFIKSISYVSYDPMTTLKTFSALGKKKGRNWLYDARFIVFFGVTKGTKISKANRMSAAGQRRLNEIVTAYSITDSMPKSITDITIGRVLGAFPHLVSQLMLRKEVRVICLPLPGALRSLCHVGAGAIIPQEWFMLYNLWRAWCFCFAKVIKQRRPRVGADYQRTHESTLVPASKRKVLCTSLLGLAIDILDTLSREERVAIYQQYNLLCPGHSFTGFWTLIESKEPFNA